MICYSPFGGHKEDNLKVLRKSLKIFIKSNVFDLKRKYKNTIRVQLSVVVFEGRIHRDILESRPLMEKKLTHIN